MPDTSDAKPMTYEIKSNSTFMAFTREIDKCVKFMVFGSDRTGAIIYSGEPLASIGGHKTIGFGETEKKFGKLNS